MPALDVAGFVANDAGHLIVGLHEVDDTFIDVHVAAQRSERVDVACLKYLDVVRNVFPRNLCPKFVGNTLDIRVEQRVGFNHVGLNDFFVVLLPHLDFVRRRNRACRYWNHAAKHRKNCNNRNDSVQHEWNKVTEPINAIRHGLYSTFLGPGSTGLLYYPRTTERAPRFALWDPFYPNSLNRS